MNTTFLSREEIKELTGVHRKQRQIETLRSQCIPFFINALGCPIVPRAALLGAATSSKPTHWEPLVLQQW